MEITALVENIPLNERISAEHGLSLFIETQEKKILFDMGQTDLFLKNAEMLSLRPSEVDIAVLSHGHYDHGGGLETFLKINDKAPVYISRYAFEPHFNGVEKYIGLDKTLEQNKRLITVDDETKIYKDMTVYSCKDNPTEHSLGSFGLNMTDENGGFIPDDFRHEQYLLIEEDGKRILFSGCSHKSVMDIIKRFRPDVFVGGFHFSKLSLDEKLEEYAAYLDLFPTVYYTCHCTGIEQFDFMRKRMKNLNYLHCGETVII